MARCIISMKYDVIITKHPFNLWSKKKSVQTFNATGMKEALLGQGSARWKVLQQSSVAELTKSRREEKLQLHCGETSQDPA